MSVEQVTQPPALEPEQPSRDAHGVQASTDLSGRLLTDAELRREIRIGVRKFYEQKRAGVFDFLMTRPNLSGSSTRYCGTLVQRWKDGAGRISTRVAGEPATTRGLRKVAQRGRG